MEEGGGIEFVVVGKGRRKTHFAVLNTPWNHLVAGEKVNVKDSSSDEKSLLPLCSFVRLSTSE